MNDVKLKYSIELLKKAEPLALRMNPKGFYLAFSGGKDSQVLYEIAKMAGVEFNAHYQVTTLDPPELAKFIRKNYSDVVWHLPEINFYKLIIKKKMLPTRQARFCCEYLKEKAGAGTVTLTGIRKQESIKRNKRTELSLNHFEGTFDQWNNENEITNQCIGGKDKIILNPILYWTNSGIWNYIRNRKLNYCELYDHGYTRIGCVFCPMASHKSKQRDRINYPGIEKAIKKSIFELMTQGQYNEFENPDDVFNWWISNESVDVYMANKLQYKIKY